MKTTSYKILLVISAIIFIASCAKDADEGLVDDRDKFTGSWTCNDTGSVSGKSTYPVTVEKAGGDTIYIRNFYFLGSTTYASAVVSGSSVVIFAQDDDGITISGSKI